MTYLTAQSLRYWLRYNRRTGVFHRRRDVVINIRRGGFSVRARAGDIAGYVNEQGYVIVGVLGRKYKAHRLAWLYVHGSWPKGHLDHEDRDTKNNRIANLRRATRSQNAANRKTRIDSTSGLKGATRDHRNGRWMARIAVDGKRHALGYYETAEVAHAAYCQAARHHFGEFARAA